MSGLPRVVPRWRGSVVSIDDVECGPCGSRPGRQEESQRPAIVAVRRGLFVREDRRDQVTADTSQIVFFNAGEGYRVSHPAGGGDGCTALCYSEDLLRSAFGGGGSAEALRAFPRTHAPARPGFLLRLHMLRGALRQPGRDGVQIEEMALDLLAEAASASGIDGSDGASVEIGRPQRRGEAGAPRAWRTVGMPEPSLASAIDLPRGSAARRALRERVDECRWLLVARMAEPLGLGALGRAVGVSPWHLHRAFRAVTGSPIHRYRTQLRVRAALDRLAEGETDLTRLALDLGFSSHAHFTTAFRRVFGCTPSGIRGRLARGHRPARDPGALRS
jgi:AraC-like DNA-binding protein